MNHEQQHEMLVEILAKLVPILSVDELSLLAHHLGIKQHEFYDPETHVDGEWFWTYVKRQDEELDAMYKAADMRRKEIKESAL